MLRPRLLSIALVFTSHLLGAGTVVPVIPKTPGPNSRAMASPQAAPIPAPAPALTEPLLSDIERFRGSQFQWVRLQTGGPYWNRHSGGDPAFLNFLRKATNLKIDPVSHAVRPVSVGALIAYPLIYSDNLSYLTPAETTNLAEYLRRGGFLCVDACVHYSINPSVFEFLRAQLSVLRTQFPDLRNEILPPDHEIFSIYFKLPNGAPYWAAKRKLSPVLAVYDGDHLIGVINLNGMQCGWSDETAGYYSTECAQMMTNIYVYAMTR